MAVEVYKDGKKSLISPKSVQRHLAAGYTLQPDGVKEIKHPEVILPASMKLETIPVEQAEQAILKEMGMLTPLTPTTEPKKRRGRPPKAK